MAQQSQYSNVLLYQLASSLPLYQRAVQMADGKTSAELEQVAKNLCEQKGIKYEDALKAFTQMLK
jgi:hypothetical protein